MNYSSVKPFRIIDSLMVPSKLQNGKNVCFAFLSENKSFLDSIPFLSITKSTVKRVFVPSIKNPVISFLDNEYKEALISYGLLPIKSPMGDFEHVEGYNFYLDFSKYMSDLQRRYRLTRFNNSRGIMFYNQLLSSMDTIPSDKYEKVLIFSTNLDEPNSPNLKYRKIWPIYLLLKAYHAKKNQNQEFKLPFDKLFLHVYDHTSTGYLVQVYDGNGDINLPKLQSVVAKIIKDGTSKESDRDLENDVQTIVDNDDDYEEKRKIVNIVAAQAGKNPKINDNLKSNPDDTILRSLVHHNISDEEEADEVVRQISSSDSIKKKDAINQFAKYALPKEKIYNTSENEFIAFADAGNLVDNQNPKHLLNKRQSDFKENLAQDIIDTFKVLEKKPSPLKISSVSLKHYKTSSSELKPTVKDRYIIELKDDKNQKHVVHIDLPHLTDNGSFLINGQEKVLVNQIVTYPIFFFKPYFGKFTSSYSSITIHSKILSKSSYLMTFMAGYKFPLILWLAYKEGFENVLSKYGISYTVRDNKEFDLGEGEEIITLPNKKFLVVSPSTEYGKQLIEGLKYSLQYYKGEGFDVNSSDSWKNTLENYIGNRNCIYLLDQVWGNVVTPVEERILQAKNDPTNISDIILYISKQVVNGRVDDRNAIDKQRIRTSELFISLIQKQIYAAYNEYEAKKQAGDPEARLYINPTKTFSEVITSQNVQTLENINPMEEISMLTRVTPIGLGGVPDKASYPERAMNIHDTYFGNIDPLETPDGAGVGIQQQLTVGASVTNIRGMFNVKDRSQIKPTEILSTGPASIPFVESDDGCRITQAAGQMKQAIPLLDPEVPAIQSGYESLFTNLLSDNFIKKAPFDAEVIEATEFYISIKDLNSDKIQTFDIKPTILRSGQGKHGLSVFKTTVKVGDKVKKGDILAEGSNVKEGTISNGLNVLCAFMPWKGYNFEDGMVVCESLAKKFVSVHVETEDIYLADDEDVVFVANLGDKFKKGDIIFTYTSATNDVESYRHLRTDGGEIVNIEIYSNIPEEGIPEKIKPHYEKSKNTFEALHGKYPLGSFKEKGEKFEGILIRFTVQQGLSLMKGDKLNNRHFNKGVVAIIEPDDNMPLTPWGERIQMIYNPLSVINRMNTGQLCELHTGLISKNLAKYMEEKSKEEFVEKFRKVITLLDGTDNQQYSKNVVNGITSLNPVAYQKLKERVIRNGFIPLIFPPFKSPNRDKILDALKEMGLEARYPLELPEFGNVKTQPVAVGYIYVMKLEHMSEKKLYARGIGPYVSRTLAPTGGKRRSGGQMIGEYDAYSLLAWDCRTVLDEFFGPLSSDHITKNQMIAEIIQTGETTYKPAQSNPVKDLFANMMLALHLEAK